MSIKTGYLLDTNIVSDIIRNPQGRVARRIAKIGEANVCTSIIVTAELRFGAIKRRFARLTEQMEKVLATLTIVSFDAPADARYAELRTQLERAGTPIGANNMLVAAHTLALGAHSRDRQST